jgi:hypothetical protein
LAKIEYSVKYVLKPALFKFQGTIAGMASGASDNVLAQSVSTSNKPSKGGPSADDGECKPGQICENVNVPIEPEPIEIPGFVDASVSGFDGDKVTQLDLHFNGCELTYTKYISNNGSKPYPSAGTIGKAVSGRRGTTDSNYEGGPIPNGTYKFVSSAIEYRFDAGIISKYKYPDWVANKKINGEGSPEANAYGDWRVPLNVINFTEGKPTHRDGTGFYLHGSQDGNGFGSAGCIDLGTNEACVALLGGIRQVANQQRSQFIVWVSVNRTCDPWAKEAGGQQRN